MPLAERAIDSVLELRAVFARLDGLSAEQRAALFANAAEMPSDFSLIVNHAWLSEHRQGIDWVRCAQLYLGMAKQAQQWGYRQLALRCYIARGVMLDEYATDPEGALTALNEAEESLGPDPALSRARAKIYYRRKDHAAALALLRDSADKAARNDFIEQARNPQRNVVVHYLSTSPIGQERAVDDRAAGKPTLEYWRSAAAAADVAPLRKVLLGAGLSEKVESFINARDDQDLRDDFLKRMQWDCGQPDLRAVQEILAARLDRYCSEELELYADDGEHLVGNILMHRPRYDRPCQAAVS